MLSHSLAEVGHASAEWIGNKAANLAQMHALRVPVPDGLVLGRDHFERFVHDNRLDAELAECRLELAEPASFTSAAEVMRRAVERATLPPASWAALLELWQAAQPGAWTGAWTGAWMVRSSAIGEDSEAASFAGQLDSIANVRSAAALAQALRRCWGSYWSARVLFYQRATRCRLQGMGVIVQRMIDATMGGVLFTRSPIDVDALAIEYVHGHPGELVAGAVDPERLTVARSSPPSVAPFAELVGLGLELERALGGPQDIEWVVDRADKLWIVQSRPITGAAAPIPSARPSSSAPQQLFSNVNVNENYPRPISPLLYSIASEAYHAYFRNLGRMLGVREAVLEQIDPPLRHCVGVHGGRLYYNLTNIHRAIAAAPFGARLGAAFDGFVGIDEERGPPDGRVLNPSKPVRWRDAARMAAGALASFRSLERRIEAFEERIDGFAARTEGLDAMSIEQLLERFREFLDLRFHRWGDASLADLAATLSYAWLRWTLERTLGPEAAKRLPQTLLLAIPEVVSMAPVEGLWALSRIARADPALCEAFARLVIAEPDALLAMLRDNPAHAQFCAAFDEHVKDHGFRVSGELLLTTESYVERPAALLPVLARYVQIEGPAPRQRMANQAATRDRAIAEVDRQLSWAWRVVFHRALRATQRAIGYRERARQRQALLYSRLRAVIRQLGDRLVARGRLRRGDDLLFLTWREIDEWSSGHSMFPGLIGEIIDLRRREHARISDRCPPDTIQLPVGDYLRGPTPVDAVGDSELLAGVGVAGGRAIGVARVLDDLSQADSFEPGDCLVARQTDPGWAPLFFVAKGLVMERGGMLSHGAIVARELGIPGVIAVPNATRILRSNERIEIDGDRGLVRRLDCGLDR